MNTPANIRCPACEGALAPAALHCGRCDLTITGSFVTNEFAALAAEDLHFLRIFIHCEGRIRDMESALGVSYPTIKSRLAKLKETLSLPSTPAQSPPVAAPQNDILADLEAGRVTFEQAMEQLKRTRAGEEK